MVNTARYPANDVTVCVGLAAPGWLVLPDAYFSGWKAYTRPLAAEGVLPEQSLTLWRADGNFRAVHLDAGKQTVRFKYAPLSFQLGLYTSFLALMTIFLLLGWWAWGRFYRGEHEAHEVSRVAKNSLCLLYTSDAADERSRVDLGGRRIIKKKYI